MTTPGSDIPWYTLVLTHPELHTAEQLYEAQEARVKADMDWMARNAPRFAEGQS
jgi:hypothetical protein